jgi:hypothetical protein
LSQKTVKPRLGDKRVGKKDRKRYSSSPITLKESTIIFGQPEEQLKSSDRNPLQITS